MKTSKKLTADCFTGDLWYYRDSNFDNCLPKEQPAKEGTVTVHQLPEAMSFKEMAIHFFGSDDIETIKKHTLTLPMIEKMVKTRESELEMTGWSNFAFVENEDGGVSVADVIRRVGGRLWDANVLELSYGYRWSAGGRLVVCNLETRANSETLSLSALENRVEKLEEWKDRITRNFTSTTTD